MFLQNSWVHECMNSDSFDAKNFRKFLYPFCSQGLQSKLNLYFISLFMPIVFSSLKLWYLMWISQLIIEFFVIYFLLIFAHIKFIFRLGNTVSFFLNYFVFFIFFFSWFFLKNNFSSFNLEVPDLITLFLFIFFSFLLKLNPFVNP